MTLSFPEQFYLQETLIVAQGLLGATLTTNIDDDDGYRGSCSGLIVEVEAYTQQDQASHSFRGITKRNNAMFERGGTIYVYQSYGIHACLNVVTEEKGIGSAVLIRALQPLTGIETMRRRRGIHNNDIQLTNGPGKLTQAMGITLSLNGENLSHSTAIQIVPRSHEANPQIIDQIAHSGRIGITKGTELPWRFFLRKNPWVSRNR